MCKLSLGWFEHSHLLFQLHVVSYQQAYAMINGCVSTAEIKYHESKSRGLAERGQGEEQENEEYKGYILCLGYLTTID